MLGRVVLCDHWSDMKNLDLLATEFTTACLLVDPYLQTTQDIESDLTDEERAYIFTYSSIKDFKEQSQNALSFSRKIPNQKNSLDSKYAYKGLGMIANHIEEILKATK